MGTYSYSGAPVKQTVATTGTYDITGYGGAGGSATNTSGGSYTSSSGAEVGGAFQLSAGEKLEIFVGGAGKTGTYGGNGSGYGGGGGGGTFVLGNTGSGYTLLLAAGGGGGATFYGGAGTSASFDLTTSGSGAGGGGGNYGGGGGAGFRSSGASGTTYNGTNYGTGGTSVTSANNPGAGGVFITSNYAGYAGNGGFGGGGGGGEGNGSSGGGGGGGYTGGSGGTNSAGFVVATGGTSFLASAATMRTVGSAASENATNAGAGSVKLTFVSNAVCYCTGTLIRVARDGAETDVAVEHLAVGDLAVTASGRHRPIRWLGHRTLDCRAAPRPHEIMPVRVSAHAFGPDRPVRDLWVSPGHALCVDVLGEVLVGASALVNGSTVQQIEVDSLTYWHVELDSHDILLAENMPAESYIECGNRCFFVEGGVVDLHALPDAPANTAADYCRPFHNEGSLVDVIRGRLSDRAGALGWSLEPAAPLGDMHLVVDGVRIDPVTRGLAARFVVPAGADDVWLVSTAARPCDVGRNGDQRRLGVCLAALTFDDGFETRPIALDDARLATGLHAAEPGVRWTDGRALLPSALWEGMDAGASLRVDLATEALPRWIAPVARDAVDEAPAAATWARRLGLVASA